MTVRANREQQTIPITRNLQVTSCWCGIWLAVPDNLYRLAREEGRDLHCPLGHVFVFTKSRNADLKERLAEEERRRRMAQSRADRERERADHNEARRVAQKAATTKARKRHAAGVCPCCNRTFQQLSRHMKTQHPDFDPAAPRSADLHLGKQAT